MITKSRISRPNPEKVQRDCDSWNCCNAVGDRVEVTLDDRSVKETTTRSEAFPLGGHTAVIQLEGIAGCYALNRVRPI
jgi:hypothetical protein